MIETGRAKLQGILGLVLLLGASAALGGIANTKHNLSASGPGTYKATTELQICLVCHTPHNASPAVPLWNHADGAANYPNVYTSTTLVAAPGQPTGRSRLCLSCHDGTVAVGSVKHLSKAAGGGAGIIAGLEAALTGTSLLGTDLSDDHPISFGYDDTLAINNAELVAPGSLDADIRLEGGALQCTTCHDPHVEDVGGSNPKFLRRGYTEGGFGSPLCLECHNKTGWSASVHRDSNAYWNGAGGTNPFHLPGHMTAGDAVNSTVKKNGCESCHDPHNAPSGNKQLLKYNAATEDSSHLCMRCHNGNVSDPADPTYDMNIPFGFVYNHSSLNPAYDRRHLPVRNATTNWKVREGSYYTSITGGPADNLGANRHAECVDCHNPHMAQKGVSPRYSDANTGYPGQVAGGGTSRNASPVIKGAWGVEPGWAGTPTNADWGGTAINGTMSWPGTYSDTFTIVDDVQYQYQLCLKCHSYFAYGPNPPMDPWGAFDWVDRCFSTPCYAPGWNGQQTDQSMEFNPNNASYHPVAREGKNDFINDTLGWSYTASLLGNLTPQSTMGCVDCHSNTTYFAGTGAKGPHGSDVWPNLWAPYTGMTGTRTREGNTFTTHICFKCHRADSYGNGGCSDNDSGETGFGYSSVRNLHCYHVNDEDIPCQACHSAIPHGWKRKAFLIAGDGNAPDPAPYNSHGHYRYDGSYRYGLNSSMNFNIASGNWSQSRCHSWSMACD